MSKNRVPSMHEAETGIRTFLFDLDGTLADTAPDLASALNAVRRAHGRPALPFAQIRPVVSHGARALIELGFGLQPGDEGFEPLRRELLGIYRDHVADSTSLFPGMAETLQAIETQGLRWGVVTNKPAFLTEPLLAALGLAERAACVISGDTLAQRKPDPAPMLLACRHTDSEPWQCVYVGDAQRDIEAGRGAGMRTLVALFGYLGADDAPQQWGADGLIERPEQILEWAARVGPLPAPALAGPTKQ